MNLVEKAKNSALKYSGQAGLILENLNEKNFDFEKFEEWFKENKLVVGGGNIIEFLELSKQKDEDNNKQITKLPDVLK